MNGFAICAIVILVLTAAALLVLAMMRKRFAEKKVRVAIVNEGNVPSQYELRAEDLQGALAFRFALSDGGSRTLSGAGDTKPAAPPPPRGVSDPAKASAETGKRRLGCQPILRIGGVAANGLIGVGQLLPRSARGPVMRLASRLQSAQMAAMRVQRVPTQATRLGRSRLRPKKPGKGATSGPGISEPAWVQTPTVLPGETLALELQIRAVRIEGGARRSFRVLSRSVDVGDAAVVTKEGVAGFTGSFWAHRWLPYAAITAIAIVLLLVAFGLATSGLLG